MNLYSENKRRRKKLSSIEFHISFLVYSHRTIPRRLIILISKRIFIR